MVGIRTGWVQNPLWVMGMATLTMAFAFVGMASGSQPRLEILSAATRVGETPPDGWTHLVMKSVPRLTSGEWQELPTLAQKTATRFRTVILADVEGLGLDQQFILTRVGIGICIPSRDGKKEDIVVTSDRLESLSIKLSTVDEIVLDAVESELAEARIISRSSTFALLRTPATMLFQGKHSKVDLYYAFCVDPTTGRLRIGVWSMWPPATVKQQPPPPELMSLAPKTTFDCELDVHAKRVLGTVPYSWSFAIRKLPPGQRIKVTKPLGEKIVAVTKRPIDVDAEELEKLLRKVLFVPRDAKTRTAQQTSTKR